MSALLVPIRVDLLSANKSISLWGPTAEFGKLPTVGLDANGVSERNSGRPYLYSNIARRAFDGCDFTIEPGVHLHWALPDAIARGHSKPGGPLVMPAAPNRWLVTRTDSDGAGAAHWLVESDYVHPDADHASGRQILYPVDATQGQAEQPLARIARLGRTRPLPLSSSDISEGKSTEGSYLSDTPGQRLTALGWGDPLFGALYPNCYSVFGFHDTVVSEQKLTYSVIGWVDQAEQDILNPDPRADCAVLSDALAAARARYGANNPDGATGLGAGDNWARALEDTLGWRVADPGQGGALGRHSEKEVATRTLFGGAITFDPACSGEDVLHAPKLSKVYLGASIEDSLASFAADQCNSGIADNLEDQFCAVSLIDHLDSAKPACGARYHSARHRVGFAPSEGAWEWSIAANESGSHAGTAAAANADAGEAQELLALHQLAEDYAEQRERIARLRGQLMAFWELYQRCLTTGQLSGTPAPDPDRLAGLIARHPLSEIEATRTRQSDLLGQIEREEARLGDTLRNRGLRLIRHGGDPAWKAVDPMLLLAMQDAPNSPRHGKDGTMKCRLVPCDEAELTTRPWHLHRRLREFLAPQTACRVQHPILFEWSVQLRPLAVDPDNAKAALDAFTLPRRLHEGADLVPGPMVEFGRASIYSGQSLLSDQAAPHLQAKLGGWIHRMAAQDSLPEDSALALWATSRSVAHPSNTPGAAWTASITEGILKRRRGAQPLSAQQLFVCAQAAWIAIPPKGAARIPPPKPDPSLPEETKVLFAQILCVLQDLASPDKTALHCQGLNGFSTALSGRAAGHHLHPDVPLGFDDQRALAQRVTKALMAEEYASPGDGMAIQSLGGGVLTLDKLDLVDSFGRVVRLLGEDAKTQPQVGIGPGFKAPGVLGSQTDAAFLRPRLLDAARLDLRLKSAAMAELNALDHTLTTPISGFLTPNLMDHTLLVHDGMGSLLGIIAAHGDGAGWLSAPGATTLRSIATLPDKTLQSVVQWIVSGPTGAGDDHGAARLAAMIDALEGASETIHPRGDVARSGLGLLLGQPLAIVRVSAALKVPGGLSAPADTLSLMSIQARIEVADGFIDGPAPVLRRALMPAAIELASQSELGTVIRMVSDTFQKFEAEAKNRQVRIAALRVASGRIGELAELANHKAPDRAHLLAGIVDARDLLEDLWAAARDAAQEVETVASGLEIPLYLGNPDDLEDGVAGYWTCNSSGALAGGFSACHAAPRVSKGVAGEILSHGAPAAVLSPGGPACDAIVLMDPRGAIHARTGILPMVSARLPDHLADAALKSMAAVFLTAPVLSGADGVALPLPDLTGFEWSWQSFGPGGAPQPEESPSAPRPAATLSHDTRLIEGWLRLDPI